MRITGWLLLLLGAIGSVLLASAQPSASPDTARVSPPTADAEALSPLQHGILQETSLFYVVDGPTTLHNLPDANAPMGRLSMRTPVTRLKCTSDRCRVRTDEGRTGYAAASALSNVWIRVSKAERRV